MKTTTTTILAFLFLLCAALPLYAADLSDLTYTTTDGEVTIAGCNKAASGILDIPETIEGNPVTKIGGLGHLPPTGVFADCTSLTSISIPNSVTSIGNGTFEGCTSLTNVLMLGSSVTNLGGSAFMNCTSLASITIPNSVTSIKFQTFAECTSLTSISLPESVTSIVGWAFEGCTSLASITIPDGVTNIDTATFLGCTSLASVTIPEGVTSINLSAFRKCTSLTSINIPDSVTTIESRAFGNCSSLTSINIPDGVTSIEGGAFAGCTSLTAIEIGAGNVNYTAVDGLLFNTEMTILHTYLGGKTGDEYTIPDGITSIGEAAFSDCTSLASITIPDGVTHIEVAAFRDCTSLTSINIPEGVTNINRSAFSGCTSLTRITIPNSVTNLGAFAFMGCSNLARITFRGDAPTIDDYYGFLDPFGYSDETFISPDAVIIYPAGAIGYSNPFHGVEALPAASVSDLTYTTTEGNITITGCETTALGDLVIPDTIEGKPVTSIGEGAFADCTSLTSISIPNSVTSIEGGAFTGCTSLTAIEVGAGNVNYTAVDGVLFNTEMTLLHTYPPGKTGDEYTIPDGITSIGDAAFSDCTSLASITIPESVTSIGDGAFYDCNSLTSITFWDDAPTLGVGTFGGISPDAVISYPAGATGYSNPFHGVETHPEYWIGAIRRNTAKAGITLEQAATIEANSAKEGITPEQADELANSLREEIRIATNSQSAKAAARVVSLGSVGLENTVEIDGVTLAGGDRVLLAGQENAAENGLYQSDGAGGLSRASDFDSALEIDGGAHLFIQEGVAEAGQGYVLSDPGEDFELGSSALSFTRFTIDSARSLGLGQDLTVAGNSAIGGTLSVIGDTSFNGAINASSIYAGQEDAFRVDEQGNATVGSTLSVGGATTLGDSLLVAGSATFSGELRLEGSVTDSKHVTTKEYVDQKDTQLEAAIDAMNIQLAQINTQIGDLQGAVAQRDATIENLQGDLATATAERDARPTLEQVRDGRPGSVLLSVDSEAGSVVLDFTVEESEDLITWTPVEGPGVSQTLTLPEGKRFYRFAH